MPVVKIDKTIFRRTRFLDEVVSALGKNAAEGQLRCTRKKILVVRRLRSRWRACRNLTLIQTCRLNDVDPKAWLADMLALINDHTIHRLAELLPWHWSAEMECRRVAA
jgi:transposase